MIVSDFNIRRDAENEALILFIFLQLAGFFHNLDLVLMTWCSCQINIYIITLHDSGYLSDDAVGLSDVSTESCNCNLCPHEVDSLIKGVAICCPPEREANKSRNCCLRHQQLHGLMKSLSVQLDRPFVLKCVFHGTNDPADRRQPTIDQQDLPTQMIVWAREAAQMPCQFPLQSKPRLHLCT